MSRTWTLPWPFPQEDRQTDRQTHTHTHTHEGMWDLPCLHSGHSLRLQWGLSFCLNRFGPLMFLCRCPSWRLLFQCSQGLRVVGHQGPRSDPHGLQCHGIPGLPTEVWNLGTVGTVSHMHFPSAPQWSHSCCLSTCFVLLSFTFVSHLTRVSVFTDLEASDNAVSRAVVVRTRHFSAVSSYTNPHPQDLQGRD
jgi:hypothetical protein